MDLFTTLLIHLDNTTVIIMMNELEQGAIFMSKWLDTWVFVLEVLRERMERFSFYSAFTLW